MRNSLKLAVVAMLAIAPAATQAQNNAAAPAAESAQLTPEQQENFRRSVQIMRDFVAAINSKDVPQPAKTQLFNCMYRNSLAAISAETGKVFASDSSLDPKKPSDVYRVAARVCGLAVVPAGASEAGTAPAPAN